LEKKKQKNFVRLAAAIFEAGSRSKKFFASFFQKRRTLPSLLLASAELSPLLHAPFCCASFTSPGRGARCLIGGANVNRPVHTCASISDNLTLQSRDGLRLVTCLPHPSIDNLVSTLCVKTRIPRC
jgi:hypothetical protein